MKSPIPISALSDRSLIPDEHHATQTVAPPLPDEPIPEELDDIYETRQSQESSAPPLPDEDLPETAESGQTVHQAAADNSSTDLDGWQAIYDPNVKAYYFYNNHTKETTWDNPRSAQPSISPAHMTHQEDGSATSKKGEVKEADFAFQARFDRRTGRFIADVNKTVENYTADARADRQLSRYVDASQMHEDGRSLRAERAAKEYSKQEMKVFKQKYKEKREHRRRAWLLKD